MFAAPRPAPRAPGQVGDTANQRPALRAPVLSQNYSYSTTSQRLQARPPADDPPGTGQREYLRDLPPAPQSVFGAREPGSEREYLHDPSGQPTSVLDAPETVGQQEYLHNLPSRPGSMPDSYGDRESYISTAHQSQMLSTARPSQIQSSYTYSYVQSPVPLTASQDFSQPRPTSGIQTLPSLYEPPTGAARYTAGADSEMYIPPRGSVGYTSRDSEMLSPASKYPITERPVSEDDVGAALGSARRPGESLWGRRLSGRTGTPLPRSVSEES